MAPRAGSKKATAISGGRSPRAQQDQQPTAEGGLRRQEVLDCAMELFAERGFDGTSLNDIAQRTTLKKASLYHYFPSKQHILATVLEDEMNALWDQAHEIAKIADPMERIRQLLAAHLSNFRRKLPQIRVFLLERTQIDTGLASTYLQKRRDYDALYIEAIKEGQKQGVLRVDDPVVLAYAVLGIVNWMVQWYDPKGRLSLEEVSAILQRCALAALCADAEEPRLRTRVPRPSIVGRTRTRARAKS